MLDCLLAPVFPEWLHVLFGVKIFDKKDSAATKHDKANKVIIPRQVNGSINREDKKLPQNEMQFTTADFAVRLIVEGYVKWGGGGGVFTW